MPLSSGSSWLRVGQRFQVIGFRLIDVGRLEFGELLSLAYSRTLSRVQLDDPSLVDRADHGSTILGDQNLAGRGDDAGEGSGCDDFGFDCFVCGRCLRRCRRAGANRRRGRSFTSGAERHQCNQPNREVSIMRHMHEPFALSDYFCSGVAVANSRSSRALR